MLNRDSGLFSVSIFKYFLPSIFVALRDDAARLLVQGCRLLLICRDPAPNG